MADGFVALDAGPRDVGVDGAEADAAMADAATDAADDVIDATPGMDGATPDTPITPLRGCLVAFRVEGARYETDTQSGVTGADGCFDYVEGEDVRFYIGDVEFGAAVGAAELTLFDLTRSREPLTGREIVHAASWDPAFRLLINTAVFLHSLDDNNDPLDGIQVLPSVAALFDEANVFLRRWDDEFHIGDFNRAMLAAQELFSVPHPLCQRWKALRDLYESRGVDVPIFAIRGWSIPAFPGGDQGGGYVSRTPDGQVTYGDITDGSGFRQVYVIDIEYDEHGYIDWENGEPAGFYSGPYYTPTHHRDAVGNLNNIDWGPRGDTRESHEYTRDEHGYVTLDVVWRTRIVRSTTTWEYNDSHTIATGRADFGVDGVIDRVSEMTLDEAGNLLRLEEDIGADGSIDRMRVRVWTDHLLVSASDRNSLGGPTREQRWERDSVGRVTRYEDDTDGDGTADTTETTSYYPDGRRRELTRDTDGDGSVDWSEVLTYDALGYPSHAERVIDGVPESEDLEVRMDPEGNLLGVVVPPHLYEEVYGRGYVERYHPTGFAGLDLDRSARLVPN